MAQKGRGSKTVRHFTAEETLAVRAALVDRPRDLSLFDVGVHLGVRGGDLLALKWPQVLNRSLSNIGDSIALVEQKTQRSATYPVSAPIRSALTRWRVLSEKAIEGYVWPSRKGSGRMNVSHLHYLVNSWAKAAGVHGHFGSHSLRKSFGRAYLAAGGSVEQLQQRLGHSSPASTKHYLGISTEEADAPALEIDLTAPELTASKPRPSKRRAPQQGVLVTNTAAQLEPSRAMPPEVEVKMLRSELRAVRKDVSGLRETFRNILSTMSGAHRE